MPPKTKKSKQDPLTALSPGNINLTKNIYSILSKKEDGNVLFSPFSIEMGLILTYIGAKENTEKEIREALQLPANINDTLEAVKKVLDTLEEAKVLILIANGLFLDKDFKIKKDYDNNSKKYFSALVKNLDFERKKESIEVINKFVENRTNKIIVNALNQDAIKDGTRALVINTVYFKGFWEEKFDPYRTWDSDFHINETEFVKVKFMHMTNYLMYSRNRGYHMVKLPYQGYFEEGSKCFMILMVPLKINGLEMIENQIKNLNLIDLIEKCSNEKWVSLELPKFELNETILRVDEVLQEWQINDLFVPEIANLKGVSDESGLYVHEFVHKSYLKVSEKGTEAAAISRGGPFVGGVARDIPIMVNADRPFLFFIYDSFTKMILFFGRVKKF